ncbi:MAG TPA: thiamine pyrophosphate-binding protein [Stellaceae bacterium]|nr:thiamine pyrophosphate-binding protein [Stellaceae bacterium]
MVQRKTSNELDWPAAIHRALRSHGVKQVSYVPDAGHKTLIDLCHSDKTMTAVPLTSEEEGIGLAAGAWLGGERAVLLMQSSGVGNCVNALTLSTNCGLPILMLVTMRGEWGEFNPWQVPMGQTTPGVLQLGGVRTLRLERREDAFDAVDSAARLAFDGYSAAAVLIAQRLIGAKSFGEKP